MPLQLNGHDNVPVPPQVDGHDIAPVPPQSGAPTASTTISAGLNLNMQREQQPPPEGGIYNWSPSLSSNDLAYFGIKEMVHLCWLDTMGLGLISMLSVRCMRLSASGGHFWRVAVQSMFPLHPFQVNVDDEWCVIFLAVRISIPACLSWTVHVAEINARSLFFSLLTDTFFFCI